MITFIYTDGSKKEEKAAFGVYCELGTRSNRIQDHSSIFTAELESIRSALKHIKISPRQNKKYVIFCDSKSVLENIENQDSKNPLVIAILDMIQELKSKYSRIIKFCWVPSHIGIRGNECADRVAKEALENERPTPFYKVPHTDLTPKVKSFIRSKWQQRWVNYRNNKGCKLFELLPDIKPFYLNCLSRKDEVVIHRIRIGHTRLTHRYLMEDPFKRVPRCAYCNLDVMSVKHLMIEWLHFAGIRLNHYRVDSMKDLFEKVPLRHIIGFLREANLYNEI